MDEARATLYLALAEALGEPPVWLALPGREWPLYEAATALGGSSPAAAKAVRQLALVPAEPRSARQARYRSLISSGESPVGLYESLARGGRLLGPESARVEQFYNAAGLAVPAGELADHASLELAFLAHLAQEAADDPAHAAQWRRVERQFARRHPARWLPQTGRALAASGDAVYGPVGALLAGWLSEVAAGRSRRDSRPSARRLPQVAAAGCTLCGFCVQACPAGALVIREDANWTSLALSAVRCNGCARCVPACPAGAIRLQAAAAGEPGDRCQPLFRSPRAQCPACAQPTVSEAELAFVAGQIGHPAWLDYCISCRT